MSLLWTAGVLLCVLTLPARPEITITHHERSLQPGEIIVFDIHSSEPVAIFSAEVFGRKYPVFPQGEDLHWTCLVGIDLATSPGSYILTLQGSGPGGQSVTAVDTLVVAGKSFPTRKLAVDEKFVTPPESELKRIREEGERVRAIFETISPHRYWKGGFVVPVPGPPVSTFGKRSVYNGQPRSSHSGTDFRGATGTPIKAPNDGRVVLAAALYYSGNTVILDHGYGLYSYLGHMSTIAVKEGDLVKEGTVVGKVGATGLVTGPHLHWSVRLAGTRVDPLSLLAVLK